MVVDRDFLVPEYYNKLGAFTLWNQAFFYPTLAFNVWDIPGFPVGNHALNSSPYGSPGVRVRVDPIETVYVQAAVYDGLPDTSYHGTRVQLDGDEGALAYFELGYRLNQGPNDHGLPGNFKLGAFYHTDDFSDNRSVLLAPLTGVPPKTHAGTYGAYFLVDQMLYRERDKDDLAQQGMAGFFRVAGAPSDRNLTQLEISGGVSYRGLLPGRDWDSVSLAASYLQISDDLRETVQDINDAIPGAFPAVPDYEGVVELNYKAQMTAWWTLQVSLQRVIHPSGQTLGDISDAWALVFASTLRF
jgi:porin